MTKKTYVIPYQYTVLSYAHVQAESIDEAIRIVKGNAPSYEGEDFVGTEDDEIKKIFSEELGDSFKILKHEIRDHNDLSE